MGYNQVQLGYTQLQQRLDSYNNQLQLGYNQQGSRQLRQSESEWTWSAPGQDGISAHCALAVREHVRRMLHNDN